MAALRFASVPSVICTPFLPLYISPCLWSRNGAYQSWKVFPPQMEYFGSTTVEYHSHHSYCENSIMYREGEIENKCQKLLDRVTQVLRYQNGIVSAEEIDETPTPKGI